MKIIGIVKGLILFVYIHNKNKYLLFFINKPKNRMELSAVWFNFVQQKKWTNSSYSKKHLVKNNPIWVDRTHLGLNLLSKLGCLFNLS